MSNCNGPLWNCLSLEVSESVLFKCLPLFGIEIDRTIFVALSRDHVQQQRNL